MAIEIAYGLFEVRAIVHEGVVEGSGFPLGSLIVLNVVSENLKEFGVRDSFQGNGGGIEMVEEDGADISLQEDIKMVKGKGPNRPGCVGADAREGLEFFSTLGETAVVVSGHNSGNLVEVLPSPVVS